MAKLGDQDLFHLKDMKQIGSLIFLTQQCYYYAPIQIEADKKDDCFI